MREPIKAQERFKSSIEKFIESLGGKRREFSPKCYDHIIMTPLGKMRIKVHTHYIHCRFECVERARDYFGHSHYGRLNTYTGKWNWYYHNDAKTLNIVANGTDEFFYQMEKIMKIVSA